jgi:glycosyltransferase involved in cell wall biosynthesis
MPQLSIVIPSFNQGRFVAECLDSVASLPSGDVEIIFMDGGSTDQTMRIVAKYAERIAFCTSEPDNGQSDALSKGFARAQGRFLTWLNTDDVYLGGGVAEFLEVSRVSPNQSWFAGNVVRISETGKVLLCSCGDDWNEASLRRGMLNLFGPSSFFKRELFEAAGGLDSSLHYQMDTDLWWRFAKMGEKFARLDRFTWALRVHHAAKTSAMFAGVKLPKRMVEETEIIRSRYHLAQSSRTRRIRSIATRAQRMVSGTYLRTAWITARLKGKRYQQIDWDKI